MNPVNRQLNRSVSLNRFLKFLTKLPVTPVIHWFMLGGNRPYPA